MSANQAAWLDEAGKTLRVGPAAIPTAGPGEVVIRNHAVAINPIDHKIQDSGFIIQSWPAILGEDVAGEIHEVGSDVTKFKKGDRVVAHAIMFVKQDPSWGAFQKYVLADAGFVAKVPDTMSYVEASVFPLALDAAAAGLYAPIEQGGLGLPLPSPKPTPSGKVIVVWGGGSSVGSQVIQLAVASGATVIAVAGAANLEHSRNLGAAEAFDYRSPSVVEDVVKSIAKGKGQFVGVYDAISLPPSYKHTLPILEKAGGKQLAIVTPVQPEKPPKGLNIGTVFAINPLVKDLWAEWVTPALASGQLRSTPQAWVIGDGLESIQGGIDASKKGVSAKKVVVTLSK